MAKITIKNGIEIKSIYFEIDCQLYLEVSQFCENYGITKKFFISKSIKESLNNSNFFTNYCKG